MTTTRTPPPIMENPPLCDRIVLLDGLTRTGKFLAAKLVSQLRRVEHFNYSATMEHVAILWRLGALSDSAAVALLRMTADMTTYDRMIGRNLNTRIADASFIGHAADYAGYLARTTGPEHESAVAAFRSAGRIPFYLTHELLPQFELCRRALPGLQIVEMVRHPVDVAHSWHRRGWGERFGVDPLAITPVAEVGGIGVPWFAMDRADIYCGYNPVQRCVASVLALGRLGDEVLSAMAPAERAAVLVVPYERMVVQSRAELERVASFIGTEPDASLPVALARERLPGRLDMAARARKLDELRTDLDADLLERLRAAADAYERDWAA